MSIRYEMLQEKKNVNIYSNALKLIDYLYEVICLDSGVSSEEVKVVMRRIRHESYSV